MSWEISIFLIFSLFCFVIIPRIRWVGAGGGGAVVVIWWACGGGAGHGSGGGERKRANEEEKQRSTHKVFSELPRYFLAHVTI